MDDEPKKDHRIAREFLMGFAYMSGTLAAIGFVQNYPRIRKAIAAALQEMC